MIDIRQTDSASIILTAMGLDPDILNNKDLSFHKQTIVDWLLKEAELNLKDDADITDTYSGYNIINQLNIASKLTDLEQIEAIFKAYRKAQMLRYGLWSSGRIKSKKEPMSEEAKIKLSGVIRPTVIDMAKVSKLVSLKSSSWDSDNNKIEAYFEAIYGYHKEKYNINLKKRWIYEAILDIIPTNQEIKNKLIKTPAKVPLYQDKVLQKEKINKFKDRQPHNFREDSLHPGRTILDITCIDCKNIRTISPSDLHNVTRCELCQYDHKRRK